jgi:hypothetical protein
MEINTGGGAKFVAVQIGTVNTLRLLFSGI